MYKVFDIYKVQYKIKKVKVNSFLLLIFLLVFHLELLDRLTFVSL